MRENLNLIEEILKNPILDNNMLLSLLDILTERSHFQESFLRQGLIVDYKDEGLQAIKQKIVDLLKFCSFATTNLLESKSNMITLPLLPGEIWTYRILDKLALRDKAKLARVSKDCYNFVDSSLVTDTVVPFVKNKRSPLSWYYLIVPNIIPKDKSYTVKKFRQALSKIEYKQDYLSATIRIHPGGRMQVVNAYRRRYLLIEESFLPLLISLYSILTDEEIRAQELVRKFTLLRVIALLNLSPPDTLFSEQFANTLIILYSTSVIAKLQVKERELTQMADHLLKIALITILRPDVSAYFSNLDESLQRYAGTLFSETKRSTADSKQETEATSILKGLSRSD